MPVYNGEKYVGEAIESILTQTFADFEFLIINDCSTDKSVDIIGSYRDNRIRLLHNEVNMGLIDTLNKGIDLATGGYIARMDQDDISMPERLQRQVAFMETHPGTAVCGTWAVTIDEDGKPLGKLETPVGPRIDKDLWRPSPIIHPSAFMRTSVARHYKYNRQFIDAEDYELWLRISKDYPIENIGEYLLHYRISPTSITTVHRQRQLQSTFHAFITHVGPENMSYEEFCSLLFLSNSVHPFRRMLKSSRLLMKGWGDVRFFIWDNYAYFRYWMNSHRTT
jgi:glycosyltransferase involved in cell wall biosynthesis